MHDRSLEAANPDPPDLTDDQLDQQEMQARLAVAPDPDVERRRQERMAACPSGPTLKRPGAHLSEFGVVMLSDGSYAKALPDGKVGDVLVVEAEWVDDETEDEPTPKAELERHAARVRPFAADVQAQRLSRARERKVSGRSQPTRARAREPRPRRARRTSSSSTTSSADPPSGEGGSPRRCQACGADISYRRADARTCDALCRKALSRGKTASPAPAVTQQRGRLEDEIDARARQRHLAWSATRPDRALIGDLDATLADLYAELRRRRAGRWRRDGFAGRSGSVVALHPPPQRHPWPATQAAYRRREEVAA